MKKLTPVKFPTVKKVPAPLATEIGRIITRFAFLEHRLSLIIYGLMNIGEKQGRIAIKGPRVQERMEIIRDLLGLKNYRLKGDIGTFINFLKNLETERDKIAHGIWVRHPDTKKICLRVTKGNWNLGSNEKIKRIVSPEAVEYEKDQLKLTLKKVDHAIKQVDQIDRMLEKAFRTSQKKSRQLHQP